LESKYGWRESRNICIDAPNFYVPKALDILAKIRQEFTDSVIMVGNIAHPAMYQYCCQARVDYVRVGIGGGSVCSTSVQTSIHASHQWMIEGIKKIQNKLMSGYQSSFMQEGFPYFTKVIADGGINRLDKAIKCLAIGYDYVMMGKCFAECEEACGEIAVLPEGKMRCYYGMASLKGQEMISGSATKNPEGIETWIPVTNTLPKFTAQFEAALRSTMSYVGAHNLDELRNNTQYDIQSIEEFKSYYK
jgi:IMP dehydrogenase